jgi:hypothetical protein
MIDYNFSTDQTIEYYFNDGRVNQLWKEIAEWHSGYISLGLYLQPIDGNATTYTITASFAGDQPANATAYDNTLGGTTYAECTTVQYDYEPSNNSTVLTVTPQSTQATTPTGTPQQMQQEAKNSGWLSVYSQWSWWYPWYRLHIKINLDPTIDVGFNPILPSGETCHFDSLAVFANTVEQVWQDITIEVGGLLFAYVLAKSLSATPLWLAIELAKSVLQYGDLMMVWSQSDEVLAISLASFIMGLIACSGSVAAQFVKNLESLIWAGTMSAIYASVGGMINIVSAVSFFHTEVDPWEILSDFGCGVFALAHYLGYI